MGNVIENFVANKLFGGIIGNKPASTSNSETNIPIRSEYNSSNKQYIAELQAKNERVNSTWNKIKQRFGFGESLTPEESVVLHREGMKEALRRSHLSSDFKDSRASNW